MAGGGFPVAVLLLAAIVIGGGDGAIKVRCKSYFSHLREHTNACPIYDTSVVPPRTLGHTARMPCYLIECRPKLVLPGAGVLVIDEEEEEEEQSEEDGETDSGFSSFNATTSTSSTNNNSNSTDSSSSNHSNNSGNNNSGNNNSGSNNSGNNSSYNVSNEEQDGYVADDEDESEDEDDPDWEPNSSNLREVEEEEEDFHEEEEYDDDDEDEGEEENTDAIGIRFQQHRRFSAMQRKGIKIRKRKKKRKFPSARYGTTDEEVEEDEGDVGGEEEEETPTTASTTTTSTTTTTTTTTTVTTTTETTTTATTTTTNEEATPAAANLQNENEQGESDGSDGSDLNHEFDSDDSINEVEEVIPSSSTDESLSKTTVTFSCISSVIVCGGLVGFMIYLGNRKKGSNNIDVEAGSSSNGADDGIIDGESPEDFDLRVRERMRRLVSLLERRVEMRRFDAYINAYLRQLERTANAWAIRRQRLEQEGVLQPLDVNRLRRLRSLPDPSADGRPPRPPPPALPPPALPPLGPSDNRPAQALRSALPPDALEHGPPPRPPPPGSSADDRPPHVAPPPALPPSPPDPQPPPSQQSEEPPPSEQSEAPLPVPFPLQNAVLPPTSPSVPQPPASTRAPADFTSSSTPAASTFTGLSTPTTSSYGSPSASPAAAVPPSGPASASESDLASAEGATPSTPSTPPPMISPLAGTENARKSGMNTFTVVADVHETPTSRPAMLARRTWMQRRTELRRQRRLSVSARALESITEDSEKENSSPSPPPPLPPRSFATLAPTLPPRSRTQSLPNSLDRTPPAAAAALTDSNRSQSAPRLQSVRNYTSEADNIERIEVLSMSAPNLNAITHHEERQVRSDETGTKKHKSRLPQLKKRVFFARSNDKLKKWLRSLFPAERQNLQGQIASLHSNSNVHVNSAPDILHSLAVEEASGSPGTGTFSNNELPPTPPSVAIMTSYKRMLRKENMEKEKAEKERVEREKTEKEKAKKEKEKARETRELAKELAKKGALNGRPPSHSRSATNTSGKKTDKNEKKTNTEKKSTDIYSRLRPRSRSAHK